MESRLGSRRTIVLLAAAGLWVSTAAPANVDGWGVIRITAKICDDAQRRGGGSHAVWRGMIDPSLGSERFMAFRTVCS